jgi:hypothetical protein
VEWKNINSLRDGTTSHTISNSHQNCLFNSLQFFFNVLAVCDGGSGKQNLHNWTGNGPAEKKTSTRQQSDDNLHKAMDA